MKAIAPPRLGPKPLLLAIATVMLAAMSWGYAQERRERPGPDDPQAEAPRERDDGRAGDEPGDQAGTPEGMPQTRIAPPGDPDPRHFPRRWMLGVHAYNTSTGVVVTRVAPGSAAAEAGVEPRDRIVSVDGFQVGYVNGRLYTLGDELQHRAGRSGRVQLLVQNWRNDQLLNLDVRLTRDDYYYPAPRER